MKKTYSFANLRSDLRWDILAYLNYAAEYNQGPRGWISALSAVFTPSVFACVMYRLSHYFFCRGCHRTSLALALANQTITKVGVCPGSSIGAGLYIPHPASCIIFQGNAGDNLRLFAAAAVTTDPPAPIHAQRIGRAPTLGNNVALGAKAHVRGAIVVGDNVQIAFNTVVSRDIPAHSRVLGVHIRNKVCARP